MRSSGPEYHTKQRRLVILPTAHWGSLHYFPDPSWIYGKIPGKEREWGGDEEGEEKEERRGTFTEGSGR